MNEKPRYRLIKNQQIDDGIDDGIDDEIDGEIDGEIGETASLDPTSNDTDNVASNGEKKKKTVESRSSNLKTRFISLLRLIIRLNICWTTGGLKESVLNYFDKQNKQ